MPGDWMATAIRDRTVNLDRAVRVQLNTGGAPFVLYATETGEFTESVTLTLLFESVVDAR